jgi:hypothetical protein
MNFTLYAKCDEDYGVVVLWCCGVAVLRCCGVKVSVTKCLDLIFSDYLIRKHY